MNEIIEAEVTNEIPEKKIETKLETKLETKNENRKEDPPSISLVDGSFSPSNLKELKIMAESYLRSGFLPERFDTQAKVIVAYQMAKELKLAPLVAMRQIAVIEGTPSVYGDLPLALAQRSGLLESIEEFFIDEAGDRITWQNKNLSASAWGAVCLLKRKGDAAVSEYYFTLDQAKEAKLYPPRKPNMPWSNYTADMLKYKARSRGLKSKFADCLNGISISEYDFDVRPNHSGFVNSEDIDPARQNAAKLLMSHLDEKVPQ